MCRAQLRYAVFASRQSTQLRAPVAAQQTHCPLVSRRLLRTAPLPLLPHFVCSYPTRFMMLVLNTTVSNHEIVKYLPDGLNERLRTWESV